MSLCRYKIGFLSLRNCGRGAVDNCTECNRPVCSNHMKKLENAGILCPECYANTADDDWEDGHAARYRRSFYDSYSYRPYSYIGHYYHDYDDYSSFEEDEEYDYYEDDDIEPSDFQDS